MQCLRGSGSAFDGHYNGCDDDDLPGSSIIIPRICSLFEKKEKEKRDFGQQQRAIATRCNDPCGEIFYETGTNRIDLFLGRRTS